MDLYAYLTIFVVIAVLALLALTRLAPDVILMAAMAVLVISGTLSPAEALAGFANPGVITIATLYIVAAGLKESGAVQYLAQYLLGHPKSVREAQVRLFVPVSGLSAFMNNTAVVTMLIPAVQQWAQRIHVSSSKLLLPLSYAAIMGGTVTLIGTSTNLVVDGLLQSELNISLQMFELAWVGLPIIVVGGVFTVLFSDKLLPLRQDLKEQLSEAKEYAVEVEVVQGSPLAGKTIGQAGLRNLAFTYLAEITRQNKLITSVAPDLELAEGDRLCFIGAAEGAKELRQVNGLQPASQAIKKLNLSAQNRHLVEAVIGPDFPGLDKSIRDSRFRTRYKAVILAVSREGRRLSGKLGDIRLQAGDTLLLEAGHNFVDQYRFRKDFLLVSLLNDSAAPDFSKAPVALALLSAMVIGAASGWLSIMEAAFLTAGGMLAARCITPSKARRYIDISVLVVIAASFSLAAAVNKTGLSTQLAEWLIQHALFSPWTALIMVYVSTVVLTELITNNAAAVLMFPVAVAISEQMGVNCLPFAIAIMFAASASFMTPLGYQTNLMVLGPGGYKLTDYVRLGLPLSLLVAVTVICLVPFVWSF